jgi:hypothetical protein
VGDLAVEDHMRCVLVGLKTGKVGAGLLSRSYPSAGRSGRSGPVGEGQAPAVDGAAVDGDRIDAASGDRHDRANGIMGGIGSYVSPIEFELRSQTAALAA